MKRRTILAGASLALSASIAGCLTENGTTDRGNENNNNGNTNDTGMSGQTYEDIEDSNDADNEPGKNFPTISVESDKSEIEGVQLAVTVVRNFDEEAPARLRVTFLNDSDETQEFMFGSIQPFSQLGGANEEHEDEQLILIPETEGGWSYQGEVPEEPINGCWGLPDEETLLVDDLATSAELAPNETISMEYDVFDEGPSPFDEDGSVCLAEGEYRFDDSDVGGQNWDFSLSLKYEWISPCQGYAGWFEHHLNKAIRVSPVLTDEECKWISFGLRTIMD